MRNRQSWQMKQSCLLYDFAAASVNRFRSLRQGPLVRIEGGWRVWSSARFHVDVLAMLGGNLRVVTTPVERPLEYTRAWCFQRPLVEVVLLALAFDPDDGGVGASAVWVVGEVGGAVACGV